MASAGPADYFFNMNHFVAMIPIAIVVLMGATLVTLVFGVISMGRTGSANRRRSNKLMQLRVALQGAAVFLAIIFAWLAVS
jgi:NADH:ubiquinone oxidoreductase subunit 6 (subunit J)